MSKIQARWWIGAIALMFTLNFVVANLYLPFTAPPHLGIQFHFGADEPRVWKVEPGSPASAASIHPDDVVKSVAGRPVASVNEFFLYEQLLRAKGDVPISVERSGRLQDLSMPVFGSYYR